MAQSQSLSDLSSLSKEEVKSLFSSVDTVLVDCDGVLWFESNSLPGSIEVINRLKELGKKVFLVSNNATRTPLEYVKKCSSLGCKVEKSEVIIPSVVIGEYLKAQDFKGKAFVIGSQAMKETLKAMGIELYNATAELKEISLSGFVDNLESLDFSTAAVILDFEYTLDYLRLQQAATLLMRTNAIFILGATDYRVPVTKDITILGPGYFADLLESDTKRKPIILGKPSPIIAEVINRRHSLVPERTLMIGDSMTQDICLGKNCGFQTLLVLTGVSTLEDAASDPDNQPTHYIKTLGNLLPLLY